MIGIGGILNRLMTRYGLETKLLESRLRDQWRGIVGEGIAAHTIPVRIRYPRLCLWVDSPAWADQLRGLKSLILKKVNERFNSNRPFKDMTFETGSPPLIHLETPQTTHINVRPGPLRQSVELTPDLKCLIEESLKSVGDAQLRQVLRRVMMKDLTSHL